MIDLGWLGHIAFTWEFLVAVITIIIIDLVLAGDNAVVIAMAVKNLHGRERKLGIILGSAGAVLVRVICTFMVSWLLNVSFVKLVGGLVIFWIAVKLLTEGTKDESHTKEATTLWAALYIIIIADLSMGIDNMLAVGAASKGNLLLLIFGLLLSIPMVVFLSTWLSAIMDRYPIILWIGAAVLGKVGGQMVVTDPWVRGLVTVPKWGEYVAMAVGVAFVVIFAKWLIARRKSRELQAAPATVTER